MLEFLLITPNVKYLVWNNKLNLIRHLHLHHLQEVTFNQILKIKKLYTFIQNNKEIRKINIKFSLQQEAREMLYLQFPKMILLNALQLYQNIEMKELLKLFKQSNLKLVITPSYTVEYLLSEDYNSNKRKILKQKKLKCPFQYYKIDF